MTHRERLLAALNHRTPDRVPMDLGSTRVTSVAAAEYEKLKQHFGIDRPTRIIDRIMQTAAVDEEILEALDIDTRGILPGSPDVVRDRDMPDGAWVDEWGVTRRLSPNGWYYELTGSPLSGSLTIRQISAYPWPDTTDEGRWRGLADRARKLREETDYAIVGHAPGGWIHISQYLRGFQDWYMDFADQPEVIVALMTRVRDTTLELARRFLDAVGPYIDVVATGDDIGAQNSLQVSPPTYRETIRPLQKHQFDTFHGLTDAKVFYHTCGDVFPVIDDLIDIGVDILNPVQVSAAEMGDTKRLKAEFGGGISFWGGVDTIDVLPAGTPEDVVAEVDRRVGDLGRDGGYVLCPVHNVQPDVPIENLLALYERGREMPAAG